MRRRGPSTISLYSGAGGLDFGLEAAGFETRVALEFDREACATLRANRDWPVVERDIVSVPSEELLDVAGLRANEVDLLVGGPPCQPFSKSGYWASGDSSRLADPRANTLEQYLRVLRETLPRAFLLENVAGLAFTGKDEGLQYFLDGIARINHATRSNYRPVFKVLRAVDYGVPQQRERLFVVGQRDGVEFAFPEPTHRDPDADATLLNRSRPTHRSAWNALGDLPVDTENDLGVRGKWAALLPSIPEGQNYLWHTERGGGLPLFGWRRRYWCFLLKLQKNRPAWTIQAQPGPATGPFHWSNRRLSMRELCRLQTFPDDVRILGNYQAIHRQVGNAVPSLLAEILGREIRAQLLGHRTRRQELKLLPPCNTPPPPAEPIGKVPPEYLVLQGDHSPHPGTGQGFGASRRSSASAR